MKGYVQVYTGDGKGKTNAAIGLSIRAAGASLKVYIAQFIKMGDYSEIKALKKFSDLITVEQFGFGSFIKGRPSEEDMKAAMAGIEKIKSLMVSSDYDIIILEEANVASKYGLISVNDILDLISSKPENMELVITGRGADPEVVEKADLVTEMKEIKHYFQKGIQARVGI